MTHYLTISWVKNLRSALNRLCVRAVTQVWRGLDQLEPRLMLSATTADLSDGWVYATGGTGDDKICDIAMDNDGYLYAVGEFNGTVDFDPTSATQSLTSAGEYDAFVFKYDTNTNTLCWVRQIATASNDRTEGIALDATGNVYASGYQSMDGYNGPPTTCDAFVAKYDSAGNLLWQKLMTSDSNGVSNAKSIAVGDGMLFATGLFGGTVDFDPGAVRASVYQEHPT